MTPTRSWARRILFRVRHRMTRQQMLPRQVVIERLRRDPEVVAAIVDHSRETGMTREETAARVEVYLEEIVPAFSLVSFSTVAYRLAKGISQLLYRTTVTMRDGGLIGAIPRGDVIIYLGNHRSNADYVVLTAVLGRALCISYAAGEWARTWPLEGLFSRFGAYFVRRGFREALYHRVLASYVRMITRQAVVQGIFPEGGLTRTGHLLPPRLGLLDSILTTLTDPAFHGDIHFVPVGINYDRVLEDRVLLAEQLTGRHPGKLRQLVGVVSFLGYNLARVVTGQYRRYGQAAVVFGAPISVREWLERHPDVDLTLDREGRHPAVQLVGETIMEAIGALVPVTPTALLALTLVRLGGDSVGIPAAREAMATLRAGLRARGVPEAREELSDEEVWVRASRGLRARRILEQRDRTIRIVPGARPLLLYYAHSIGQHLDPV